MMLRNLRGREVVRIKEEDLIGVFNSILLDNLDLDNNNIKNEKLILNRLVSYLESVIKDEGYISLTNYKELNSYQSKLVQYKIEFITEDTVYILGLVELTSLNSYRVMIRLVSSELNSFGMRVIDNFMGFI